jgi:hypothetical protein
VPKEQQIDADDDGYHRDDVEHDGQVLGHSITVSAFALLVRQNAGSGDLPARWAPWLVSLIVPLVGRQGDSLKTMPAQSAIPQVRAPQGDGASAIWYARIRAAGP